MDDSLLSGFVYHQNKQGTTYRVTFPKGNELASTDSVLARSLVRRIDEEREYPLDVLISRTSAPNVSEFEYSVVVSRGVNELLGTERTEFSVSSSNIEALIHPHQGTREEVRNDVLEYVLERFDDLPAEPFHTIEFIAAISQDPKSIINSLRYFNERKWIVAESPGNLVDNADEMRLLPLVLRLDPSKLKEIEEKLQETVVSRTGSHTIKKAFLSYRTVDKKLAGQIKGELEKHGIRVFLAHDDIEPSFEWKEKILIELNQCDIFLPLLTDNFRGSEYTDQEAGIAFAGEKVILPLKVTQNPHGFIERFQALTVKPDNVALSCNKLIRFLIEHHGFQSTLDKDLSK